MTIKCLLDEQGLSKLQSLKNQSVNLCADMFGNKTIAIKMQSDKNEYFIINTPTLQKDGDEYPIMSIENNYKSKLHENFAIKNARFENMYLERDIVKLFRKEYDFNIVSDIGIRISTDIIDLLIIMRDSIIGIIDVYLGGKLSLHNTEEELKDQWGFKADEFELLKREEIQLF